MNIPNTIRILPNIYLMNKIDSFNSSNQNLSTQEVNNLINDTSTIIITINNHCEKIINEIDNQNNVINLDIQQTDINFKYTNELIVNYLRSYANIIIISQNNLLGFIIMCVFMISNLDVSLYEILVLCKYYSININYPSINYIDQINKFIKQNKNKSIKNNKLI